MRKMLVSLAIGVIGLVLAPVQAQIPPRHIYSNPELPAPEALRRLNLTQAWYRYLPTQGRRDGLLSVQLIENDMLVQTKSGLITRLDAETGTVRWRTQVGVPYQTYQALSANRRSVFTINSNYLYALDRETGTLQWRTRLPAGVTAPPAVAELALYLPTATGRLYAFTLPVTNYLASRGGKSIGAALAPPGETADDLEGAVGPQPGLLWSELTGLRLEFSPLLALNSVLAVSPTGDAVAYSKIPTDDAGGTRELYRFQSELPLSVPPGQFGDVAYIGSRDANIYALGMSDGRLRWRHTAGTAIARRPVALEQDVYVTTEKEGLLRLDRATGEATWRVPSGRQVLPSNPEADRFLAANYRFVYATDPSNRLLVLDRKRGTVLSRFDTVQYRFPVPNQVTDRLYLASNDGLIVCLHDRDQVTPIRHRRAEEEASDPVRKKLLTPVSDPGGRREAFRSLMTELAKKHDLKIVALEKAFAEIGVTNLNEREVKMPRLENRPLRELLEGIFNQVDATYEIVGDTVFVMPAKARPKS